jgi:hypothetical protein
LSNPPLVKPRASLPLFSGSNAILVIVSLGHAVNHAYSTLTPLIYPLVMALSDVAAALCLLPTRDVHAE